MSAKPYAEMLKDPRWQRKRLKVMDRDEWRCRRCRDGSSSLQVHHKRYVAGKAPWEVEDRDLVTLCERCHERATMLMRQARDILGGLDVDHLEHAVAMLETWTGGAMKPLQFVLEECERQRATLIGLRYSSTVSRRLEALDELAENVWEVLDAGTPRTYGA